MPSIPLDGDWGPAGTNVRAKTFVAPQLQRAASIRHGEWHQKGTGRVVRLAPVSFGDIAPLAMVWRGAHKKARGVVLTPLAMSSRA
jgi:hypothetical protein